MERHQLVRRGVAWLRARLWVRPLLYSTGALVVAALSGAADLLPMPNGVPEIPADLISTLMSVLTASMLGIATFAVASMVSAYASVGSNATPRAFELIVADDMSKRALSTFVGAFIFGTIGLIALNLRFYNVQGRFALFSVTLVIYAWVIWTFVSWVDAIARLGRLETAIRKVEAACREALCDAARAPTRGALRSPGEADFPHVVESTKVGYVLDIDMGRLQRAAEAQEALVLVAATPGEFVGPGRPVARLDRPVDAEEMSKAFYVGTQRTFSGDPRFGMVALAQIASRALSPGVNDPGTAIDVLGATVRLLVEWSEIRKECEQSEAEGDAEYPAVRFPSLAASTLLDDAYTSIARYGAAHLEVSLHLQRALELLARNDDTELAEAAVDFSRSALARCRVHMDFEEDLARVESAAKAVEEARSSPGSD